MSKLKIATVFGTRPEIIRLSRVFAKLDKYCEHVMVHAGQNVDYELNEIFFSDLRLRTPDHFLNAAGANGAETIGKVIMAADEVFAREQPDAVLVLGDTNSCMAAIAAKRRKIPVFHMEAGNRCFDQRVPEEINRRIIDHVADVNLTYSSIAREYLLREGLAPDLVIRTGSPMREVLDYYSGAISASAALANQNVTAREYFIASAHREENVDSDARLAKLVSVLNAVAERYKWPVILSTHPRTRKRIEATALAFHPQVRLVKPLAFTDYVKLQLHAFAVLSDSGTVNEESSILNLRALNIRDAHERPEGMEEGAVMLVGLESERVLQALDVLEDQPCGTDRLLREVVDYGVPNVSDKVVRIIHSYTDYVNRVVWRKDC